VCDDLSKQLCRQRSRLHQIDNRINNRRPRSLADCDRIAVDDYDFWIPVTATVTSPGDPGDYSLFKPRGVRDGQGLRRRGDTAGG
jgi:hypothetical protein